MKPQYMKTHQRSVLDKIFDPQAGDQLLNHPNQIVTVIKVNRGRVYYTATPQPGAFETEGSISVKDWARIFRDESQDEINKVLEKGYSEDKVKRFRDEVPKDRTRVLAFHPSALAWYSACVWHDIKSGVGVFVYFDGFNGLPIEGNKCKNIKDSYQKIDFVKFYMDLPPNPKE